jgi:hypothetical protein
MWPTDTTPMYPQLLYPPPPPPPPPMPAGFELHAMQTPPGLGAPVQIIVDDKVTTTRVKSKQMPTHVVLASFGRDPPSTIPVEKREQLLDSWSDAEIVGRAGYKNLLDDPRTYSCDGSHGRHLLTTAMHTEFDKLLVDAKRAIYGWHFQLPKNRKRVYRHGFRCRFGKHHSRSAALLIAACLRDDGFTVRVEHWDCRSCGCGSTTVTDCKNYDDIEPAIRFELRTEWDADKKLAMNIALKLWKHCEG